MDFENVLTLIKTVSDSNLTSFVYEENGTCISLKTDKKKILTISPEEAVTNKSTAPVRDTQERENTKIVKSPLVGTFYSAASPEEDAYVHVGDTVKKGQVLGIVEAMKLMNEIESDYDGVIKDILVPNEGVVEFEQPMFIIE